MFSFAADVATANTEIIPIPSCSGGQQTSGAGNFLEAVLSALSNGLACEPSEETQPAWESEPDSGSDEPPALISWLPSATLAERSGAAIPSQNSPVENKWPIPVDCSQVSREPSSGSTCEGRPETERLAGSPLLRKIPIRGGLPSHYAIAATPVFVDFGPGSLAADVTDILTHPAATADPAPTESEKPKEGPIRLEHDAMVIQRTAPASSKANRVLDSSTELGAMSTQVLFSASDGASAEIEVDHKSATPDHESNHHPSTASDRLTVPVIPSVDRSPSIPVASVDSPEAANSNDSTINPGVAEPALSEKPESFDSDIELPVADSPRSPVQLFRATQPEDREAPAGPTTTPGQPNLPSSSVLPAPGAGSSASASGHFANYPTHTARGCAQSAVVVHQPVTSDSVRYRMRDPEAFSLGLTESEAPEAGESVPKQRSAVMQPKVNAGDHTVERPFSRPHLAHRDQPDQAEEPPAPRQVSAEPAAPAMNSATSSGPTLKLRRQTDDSVFRNSSETGAVSRVPTPEVDPGDSPSGEIAKTPAESVVRVEPPDLPKATANRPLALVLDETPESERLTIVLAEHMGGVRVSVRTTDASLGQDLRWDLDQLVERLEQAGYTAEPASASAGNMDSAAGSSRQDDMDRQERRRFADDREPASKRRQSQREKERKQ